MLSAAGGPCLVMLSAAEGGVETSLGETWRLAERLLRDSSAPLEMTSLGRRGGFENRPYTPAFTVLSMASSASSMSSEVMP